MLDPMSHPTKRPKRTIYYSPTLECRAMLDAAERVLFPRREHPEFPVHDELRTAAIVGLAAACSSVHLHTTRWGTPETEEPSTWACVAWEHQRHASEVLAIVTTPRLDLVALRSALDAWRTYGR